MSAMISTGIKGLDTILGGGLLRHNSILLKGAPGTGKTLLGTQIILDGIAQSNEPGIICSFEQFPQQFYRDTRAFGWDLEALVKDQKLAIFFFRPEDLIAPNGQPQTPFLSRLFTLAEERGAKRMLVDSISHFNRVSSDPVRCRSILLDFIISIKATGVTPILTAEMGGATHEYSFEEYLVDEVILLHNDRAGSTVSLPQRSIEVTKTRGHNHVRGRHPIRIRESGIEVYPHVLPAAFAMTELGDYKLQPMETGVRGLNRLVGGGFMRGTSTIVAGMSGTYKTTLASSFLSAGARQGEKGLYITFEETPRHLVHMQAQRGVDLTSGIDSGLIQIRHYVPRECYLDAIFADLIQELESGSLQRVVIDSINDFERVLDEPGIVKDYLGMFLAALTRSSATTLLTQKLDRVNGINPIADIAYASMVDTVIYLGNVEIESRIRKVISVLKSRGARVETDVCEIQCGSDGLCIGERFHGLSGILQGTAHGQYKQTVEQIFQPLYFIRDFAQMGSGENVDPARRQKILGDILAQISSLDTALKDHFGFDPEEAKAE